MTLLSVLLGVYPLISGDFTAGNSAGSVVVVQFEYETAPVTSSLIAVRVYVIV